MSEPSGFGIYYDAPFTRENIRNVFQSLAEAVEDNWAHKDEWTERVPERVDPDAWAGEDFEDDYSGRVTTKLFAFHYSPLSMYCAAVYCAPDEQHGMWVDVYFRNRTPLQEQDYYRMTDQAASIYLQDHAPKMMWPINRPLFLHLLERLRTIFPVRKIEVNETSAEDWMADDPQITVKPRY